MLRVIIANLYFIDNSALFSELHNNWECLCCDLNFS